VIGAIAAAARLEQKVDAGSAGGSGSAVQAAGLTDAQLDVHLEAILRAGGSSLRHYSMAKPKDEMRAALRAAIAAIAPPTEHCWAASNGAPAAARDVMAERQRQISAEGWTPEHDDAEEPGGALAVAAACYALGATFVSGSDVDIWPWDRDWWKPRDARSNLVRAGALILAEIERLDRAGPPAQRSLP
jgi:hypothetical protein